MGVTLNIVGVDTEEDYRDLYQGWLGADHDVRTAGDPQEALAAIGQSTDIVLLGRDLPDLAARELAREIETRTQDCYLVMVSSEPADFDIVDYPIDNYVRKPLAGGDLDAIIEQYERQISYHSSLEEFFRLTSKLGAIEAELSDEQLTTSDRYRRLRERVEEKRAEVDEAISRETDWNVAFKSCAKPRTAPTASELS